MSMHDLNYAQVAQLCREALPDAQVAYTGLGIMVTYQGRAALLTRYSVWLWPYERGLEGGQVERVAERCLDLTNLEDLGLALCRLAQLPTCWSHLLADLQARGVPEARQALLGSPRALVACARHLAGSA